LLKNKEEEDSMENIKLSILGTGNIARSLVEGLLHKKTVAPQNIILSRRRTHLIRDLKEKGCQVTDDNKVAIINSKYIIIGVTPTQTPNLIKEIKGVSFKDKIVISVVSGVSISYFKQELGLDIPIVRAMPNTASALNESMTCLCSHPEDDEILKICNTLFQFLGQTLIIDEKQMESATALGACGLAFFLRAVRAASQGGIEIGFHSQEASKIAAQTARGAATLLMYQGQHPEFEIDKVTTPEGATISGLNEMEHQGFSSAFIKGIITSAQKIKTLFSR